MPDIAPAIFAVPEGILAGFYDRPQFCADGLAVQNALGEIRRHGDFYSREWAEQTEEVRQIIPCAIVRNNAHGLLRLKRATQSRNDLRLRHTLLFGGHIDEADAQGGDMLQNCVRRELHEELGIHAISAKITPNPIGIVADPSTPSSRRHFGVVFECRFFGDTLAVDSNCDNSEFVNARRRKAVHHFDKIGDFRDDNNFDPWSLHLLSSGFARQALGRDFRIQAALFNDIQHA